MRSYPEKDSTFRSNQKGLTLIEVLIALTIFAIGALGIATLQMNSARHTTNAGKRSTALALASDRLELIKSTPYDSMTSGTATSGDYTITWTISADGTPVAGNRTVNVTVSWMHFGDAKNVSINYIAKN